MPHSCAVKTCGNKAKTGADLSFHRLPAREPERLKLWLSALDIDANTPADELRKYIVCSEHFVPGDYTVTGQPRTDATHRFLTPTAVPTVNVTSSRLQPGATQMPLKSLKRCFLLSRSGIPIWSSSRAKINDSNRSKRKKWSSRRTLEAAPSNCVKQLYNETEGTATCQPFHQTALLLHM